MVTLRSSARLEKKKEEEKEEAKEAKQESEPERKTKKRKRKAFKLPEGLEKLKKPKFTDKRFCSVLEVQGPRDYMEDAYDVGAFENNLLFGVFDGHGGDQCSTYLKKNMLQALRKQRYFKADAKKALKTSFESMDRLFCRKHGNTGAGSTCSVGIIRNTGDDEAELYFAGVGDSRAILIHKDNKVTELSRDHKGSRKDERSRIEKLGGVVTYDDIDDIYRVGGVLAVSRAIGDAYLKPFVSGTPEIKKSILKKDKHSYICVASDGLWDDVKNQEVAYICNENPNETLQQKLENLAKLAFHRGSEDNLCIVLIEVSKYFESNQNLTEFVKDV